MANKEDKEKLPQRRQIIVPNLILPPKELKPFAMLIKANLLTEQTDPQIVMEQFDQLIGIVNRLAENVKFIPVAVFVCHKGTEFIDLAEHLYMAECEAEARAMEKKRKEVEHKDDEDINTDPTIDNNEL